MADITSIEAHLVRSQLSWVRHARCKPDGRIPKQLQPCCMPSFHLASGKPADSGNATKTTAMCLVGYVNQPLQPPTYSPSINFLIVPKGLPERKTDGRAHPPHQRRPMDLASCSTTGGTYNKKRRQGRPAKWWRDDLDKYWRDMIWQKTAQDRLTWRRHAEAFAQQRDTTAAQWCWWWWWWHIYGRNCVHSEVCRRTVVITTPTQPHHLVSRTRRYPLSSPSYPPLPHRTSLTYFRYSR